MKEGNIYILAQNNNNKKGIYDLQNSINKAKVLKIAETKTKTNTKAN